MMTAQQQQSASEVEFRKKSNVVILASAGSGKTYTLVQEYLFSMLGLYEGGEVTSPARLLAVTFTEKAASEMRARLVSLVMQLIRGNIREDIAERLEAMGRALPPEAVLRKQSRALMNAPIVTFHAYCAQLLREHAFAAGMPSNFKLLSPTEEDLLMRRVAEQVVLQAMEQSRFQTTQIVSRWGLHQGAGRLGLVDALLNTYRHMVEHGMSAKDVCVSTSFNDPKEAFQAVKQALFALEGGTPKKTPAAMQKIEDIQTALNQMSVALEEGGEPFIAHAFARLRAAAGGNFANAALRKELVTSIVKLGAALCEQVLYPQGLTVKQLLEQFEENQAIEKDTQGVYGFSDLLVRARRLLRDNLTIREQAKKRFTRILVDEFQDTSPLQEEVVACLAESRSESVTLKPQERAMQRLSLESGALLIVGDPKQSIYGFRGADAHIFEATTDKIALNGQVRRLSVCRRCDPAIVDFVNLVSQATITQGQDGVRFDKEDHMLALSQTATSQVAGAMWQASLEEGDDVRLRVNRMIASQVAELLKTHQPSDIGILVRRIKAAMPLLQLFNDLGIPARVYGGEGFFARQEVVDVLAALRLLVEPEDALAWLTVLRSPFVAISDADLAALYPHRVHELDFYHLLTTIRGNLYTRGVASAVEEFLSQSFYVARLKGVPDKTQQIRNLEKLVVYCAQFTEDPYMVIDQLWGFVDNPPRESLAELDGADGGAIQMMTIHQSKGLEFEVVVLADTWSVQPHDSDEIGFDPDVGLAVTYRSSPIAACAPASTDEKLLAGIGIDRIRKRQKERTESELARLLYVALTRAKKALYIVDAAKEGQRIRSRGVSLHSLLMQAYEQNPGLFEERMPVMSDS